MRRKYHRKNLRASPTDNPIRSVDIQCRLIILTPPHWRISQGNFRFSKRTPWLCWRRQFDPRTCEKECNYSDPATRSSCYFALMKSCTCIHRGKKPLRTYMHGYRWDTVLSHLQCIIGGRFGHRLPSKRCRFDCRATQQGHEAHGTKTLAMYRVSELTFLHSGKAQLHGKANNDLPFLQILQSELMDIL